MNCEKCSQPVSLVHAQTHRHCRKCHHFQFPDSLEKSSDGISATGRVTPFECPCCAASPLEVGILQEKAQVCFCPNCRGFVIDSETFGSLLSLLRHQYEGTDDPITPLCPTELEHHRNCPACHLMMDVHPYHGAGNSVIDTCLHCKLIWFDHNEFSRLVRAPGKRELSLMPTFSGKSR